jgi:hypothetical protein
VPGGKCFSLQEAKKEERKKERVSAYRWPKMHQISVPHSVLNSEFYTVLMGYLIWVYKSNVIFTG